MWDGFQPPHKSKLYLLRQIIEEFNLIKFEKPFFYKNNYALRFEIGPNDINPWRDESLKTFNKEYFSIAFNRAKAIYDSVFSPSEKISIVFQLFSDGRKKIKRNSLLFKSIHCIENSNISFSSHRDVYVDNLNTKRQHIARVKITNLTTAQINIIKILTAIINSDFKRYPSLNGECYIVNDTTGLVFHLYDDRGLDVVSETKESLHKLYQIHSQLILAHDRDRILNMFSQI
jgi:hypothetical protein